MKLTKIIASTLGVGLFSLTSFAVAQDKYAARFPVKGVDANPTFGMTETEKQEHIANVEMCSNEGIFETGEYKETVVNNVEVTLEAGVPVYNNEIQTYWKIHNCRPYAGDNRPFAYIDGKSVDRSLFTRGEYRSTHNCGNLNKFYEIIPNEDYTYTGRKIEKEPILEETENYQWCKNNGYSTKNN